jgi:hypothetical protein
VSECGTSAIETRIQSLCARAHQAKRGTWNIAVYQCLIAYILTPGIAPERQEIINETPDEDSKYMHAAQDHQAATGSQDQDQGPRGRHQCTAQRDTQQTLTTRRLPTKKPPGLKIKTKVRAAGMNLQHNETLARA